MLQVRPIPAFEDNYIWLVQAADNPAVAIVDPGDAEPVLAALERDVLEPVAILITHHHGDHTGGVASLLRRYDLPVYGPANERIPGLSRPVREGDHVTIAALGADFTVLDVPGHTRGHVAFYGHGMLFCGDTLFTGGCGRLFEGSAAQMHASLNKIRSLPDDTLVYCAHEYTLANLRFALITEPDNGELEKRMEDTRERRAQGMATVPSTLGLEKRTNPFLRSDVPAIITAAEKFAEHRLTGGAEVFGTVRHWKDTLD